MSLLVEPLRQECYGLLARDDTRCFLHRSEDDCSLFVSDLPRRVTDAALNDTLLALDRAGYKAWVRQGLVHVDASLPKWETVLSPLPLQPPPLPHNDLLHPAYALCRLLLLHPAELNLQPLGPLREMVKWADPLTLKPCLTHIPKLHEHCALLLRQGQPLPHAAGRVLAAWLSAANTALSTGPKRT